MTKARLTACSTILFGLAFAGPVQAMNNGEGMSMSHDSKAHTSAMKKHPKSHSGAMNGAAMSGDKMAAPKQ